MIPTRRKLKRRQPASFTLVEMLVVLGIIATLISLLQPAFSMALLKAQSTKCAGNLRNIGTAVSLCATDNNNQYPEINQNAGAASGVQIYPTGSGATNLIGALGAYGVTTNSIQCPVDMGLSPSAFSLYGSSYECNPIFDDESVTSPILYLNANTHIPVNSSRVRLCTDFNPIHHNKMNALYGDGHVIAR
jgi:prepilin-type processing-associated H-X9-DG protein